MNMHTVMLAAMASLVFASGCTQQSGTPPAQPESALGAKIRRFAPTQITADTSRLSAGDRLALRTLVEAAGLMDRLYLRQVWSGNEALLEQLARDTSPEGRERLHYYRINMGPWSQLDAHESFVPGVPHVPPPGANFYPKDMTKEEFAGWISKLSAREREQATGYFHVIRRGPSGTLQLVPYPVEYKDLLPRAAQLLREAAGATDNASLRRFLTKRADAFLSNDYYESDVAWMELDSPLDVTIGPYEVYLDELFNYKAAFEAFITLRNDGETRKLALFSRHLQQIEDNLPIAPAYRNPKLGAMAPIRVVDEIVVGGEARAGVQTAAFNLPNDERVVAEKGSKRVMLKNVQEAKFQKILAPIAEIVIDPSQRPLIAFEPFFTHILAHELMHGLGPHSISVGGTRTTVRQAMKELSSALEEAKADVSGLFALQFLMDRGTVDSSMARPMYATFLAGMFRSVRFGLTEAHGRGVALQFNYFLDNGAFVYDESTGTFAVDFGKIRSAVQNLTREIMTIQATGDYDAASALLAKYAVLRPPMEKALARLAAIPVDIAPVFPLAGTPFEGETP